MLHLQHSYKLDHSTIIKRSVTLLLLWLMLLSITPKSFLHDLLAYHTDVTPCNDTNVNGPCIHKQGFNCQQADIVVPSVYNGTEELVTGNNFYYFSPTKENYTSSILRYIVDCPDSRGPPAHA